MNFKACLYSFMNEIFEEDETPLVETYQLFYRRNKTRKKLRNYITINGKQSHTRPGLYSEIWVDLYTEMDFFLIFRLKRLTFHNLLQLIIRQQEMQKTFTGGFEPIQPQKIQQIALYYLAHQVSMAQIGDKFNVATSTVFHCINIWIKCMVKIVPIVIQWPTVNQRVNIQEKFKNIAGFPGVIGAIDGCHINVIAPSIHQRCYQNRYMTHSIIMQGICTADCLFTNIYVGHPGSANDCRVLKNSKLYLNIEANGYFQYFLPDQHLLGDKIYPIKEWLIPPFKDYGNITHSQVTFNKIHSKTRVKIENSFGLLKGRWRRLKYITVYKIEKASNIIMACCALHNFCLINNDLAESLLDVDIQRLDRIQVVRRDNNKTVAIEKRNTIMIQLSER